MGNDTTDHKDSSAGSPGEGEVEVARSPEVVEPFGWIGDWFDHWPPMFSRRFPELFDRGMSSAGALRVEQYVDGDESVIRAEIPGVDPDEDIDISVTGDRLTITAKREQREESKDDDGFRSEFHYGSFRRTMTLPSGTSADDVKATYEDGVLEVRLPSAGAGQAKTTVPIGRP